MTWNRWNLSRVAFKNEKSKKRLESLTYVEQSTERILKVAF